MRWRQITHFGANNIVALVRSLATFLCLLGQTSRTDRVRSEIFECGRRHYEVEFLPSLCLCVCCPNTLTLTAAIEFAFLNNDSDASGLCIYMDTEILHKNSFRMFVLHFTRKSKHGTDIRGSNCNKAGYSNIQRNVYLQKAQSGENMHFTLALRTWKILTIF